MKIIVRFVATVLRFQSGMFHYTVEQQDDYELESL